MQRDLAMEPIIAKILATGVNSYQGVAAMLNAAGVPTHGAAEDVVSRDRAPDHAAAQLLFAVSGRATNKIANDRSSRARTKTAGYTDEAGSTSPGPAQAAYSGVARERAQRSRNRP